MEGVGAAEETDRRRYCGTQCLGKLMNDFPANLAQRPLRIASYLAFTSQPVYRNHGTHHRGLSPHKAPSKKMPIHREYVRDIACHLFENLLHTTFS